jgi:hypothetical protein
MTLFTDFTGGEELPDFPEADFDVLIAAGSEEDPDEPSELDSADPDDPEGPKFKGHSLKDIQDAFKLLRNDGGSKKSVEAVQAALEASAPAKALNFRIMNMCFTFYDLDLAKTYAKVLPGGKLICPCCDQPTLTSKGAVWSGIKFIHTEDRPMLVLTHEMVCKGCPNGNGECKITFLTKTPSSPS